MTVNCVEISLDEIHEGLKLIIDARAEESLYVVSDFEDNGEAEYQLREGCFYDYELTDHDFAIEKNSFVQPHSRKSHLGTLAPNIYVGTLELNVLYKQEPVGSIFLEVQSVKSEYRKDYRDMLEYITEKCTDLLMQSHSPVFHNFETDFDKEHETLYQKFAFVKSIIGSEEFSESVQRIVSSPVTQWAGEEEQKSISSTKRFGKTEIRQFSKNGNRTGLPKNHSLRKHGINDVPNKIHSINKVDCVDTPENRFVKFAIESFLQFCSEINERSKAGSRLWRESRGIEELLENHLQHPIFREISQPQSIQLNSPVLQRKAGYREILRTWMMFDLAAKLIWKGGEDVYSGGKRDVATLYEYWLFFKLLDLFKEIFSIDPKEISDLIQNTKDGMSLQLKQGQKTALQGVYSTAGRTLNIRFNFNRPFIGDNKYPDSGSWSVSMRPDYTLSIWPNQINEKQAEEEELITHIHFDAKYKVDKLIDTLNGDELDLDNEKQENRKGNYKNADILKMHAYKDAIRRTGGAYVLYPGDKSDIKKGFREIIPGLGAFPVNPSKHNDGTPELKKFIEAVVEHFLNRASQREKMAYRTYDIHKNENPNVVKEALPEAYGSNRDFIPDNTFILLGYCKSAKHLEWYKKHKLYNFRMNDDAGSLIMDESTVKSKYLVLREKGKNYAEKVFKITSTGPRVFSAEELRSMNYPGSSRKYYLVINIEETEDLGGFSWQFEELDAYKKIKEENKNVFILPGIPFTVSLSELMKVKC